jgi:DNA replication protein DnaD
MLEKLYELSCLNLEKLIITYVKELGLNNDELMVLLKVVDSISKNENIVETKIADSLKLDSNYVSNTIAKFIEKNYLELNIIVEKGIGKEKYSLNALFKNLEAILNDEKINSVDESSELITFLETKFSRSLSSKEMEMALEWSDDQISLDDVKNACSQIEAKGLNLTFIRIEKILYRINRPQGSIANKIEQLLEKDKHGQLS